MNLESQVQALNAFASSLSKATSVREKIRLADRIFSTLGECEQLVEQFIVSEMGASEDGRARIGQGSKQTEQSEHNPKHRPSDDQPFEGMKLADIGRVLLKERGVMHGQEIERAAKDGGKSISENFQSYLAVAFKRDGGFENIGKNRWRLNESVQPESRHSTNSGSARNDTALGAQRSNGLSQKMKLHDWLKNHGPATRSEIMNGGVVPNGTASGYLSSEKDLFENRDGKWYAR